MNIRKGMILIPALFFLLVSCISTKHHAYSEVDAEVKTGSFEQALAVIDDEEGNVRRNIYTTRNEILLYLDRGMVNHYAGFYEESSRDLQMAEQLIEEAFTRSISQEIGTFLANDNARNYPGEDYEDMYINVFGALNYYHKQDIDSALVEIRRMNEKLSFFADRYEKAKQKAVSSNDKMNVNELPVEASSFSNSALARYLGMLFYRGTGRADSARIDSEELHRAFALAPLIYYNPVPSSVKDELSVPANKGRLNIIAFTGLSPIKEPQNIVIPLPLPFPNNTAKLSIPQMIDRPSIVEYVEVLVNSGDRFRLELLEDMGEVARETFKSQRGLIILKTTARAITKAVVSSVAAETVSRRQGGGMGLLVGLVGRVASDASEQANVRLLRFFPSRALVGAVNLDPGVYTVTVNYHGRNGRLINSEEKEINVRANALNLGQFFFLN